MHTFHVPYDEVVDMPSRRRFAHLLRQMLASRLTLDNLPPLAGLRGYGEAAQACLTQYFEGGVFAMADLAMTLLLADEALAQLLYLEGDSDAMPPSLRLLRPSELATLPPVTFLDADRMIQDRGISMIVGKPGSGKSLWALGKAHEVGQTLPVVYVAAEAQASLYDRQLALAQARGCPMPERVYTCIQPVNLRLPEQVQALTDYTGEIGARLVIFDTWAACTAGADENSTRDVQPIFNTLEAFKADTGCGILLIHHTRKDSAVYRGSSAIQAALDNMYVLTEDNGHLTLKAEKTRDSRKPEARYFRLAQYATRTEPDSGEPVYAPTLLPSSPPVQAEDDGKPVQGNGRKLLEALQASEDGLTIKALESITHLSQATLYRLVDAAMETGLIVKMQDENDRRIYRLTEEGENSLS